MDATGKVIVGVLAGVAAGAVLGILFAPAKGEDTRSRLSDSIRQAGQKLKEGTEEFVQEQGSRIKSQVQNMTEKAARI